MSVGALFVAGIIPGMVLALLFSGYVIVAAKMNPEIAPAYDKPLTEPTLAEKRSELIGGLGILALIMVVIGGIWLGWFTPTEAAAFGVICALIIGIIKGMRTDDIIQSLYQAGRTTAPIMFLLIAAQMYSRLLALGGGVNYIQGIFIDSQLSPFMLILLMAFIWLILGMLIDSISIILLTVPIFAPLAVAMGYDPVAFAIFGILIIEAGLLSPPFGLLVYTVRGSVPDPTATLKKIFIGSAPYFILILVAAFLVLAFPILATLLPKFII
jgi:tripartite ATP-independent transporter DctM subunit